MMKKETKIVYVPYCDYCGNKIKDGNYSIKKYFNGNEKHFHSVHTNKIKITCLEKFEKDEF